MPCRPYSGGSVTSNALGRLSQAQVFIMLTRKKPIPWSCHKPGLL